MWTRRKPKIEHLRVFGCVAHLRSTESHLTKLEDVQFEEAKAWDWTKTSKTQTNPSVTFTMEGYKMQKDQVDADMQVDTPETNTTNPESEHSFHGST